MKEALGFALALVLGVGCGGTVVGGQGGGGGAADFGACSSPDACLLAEPGCCGSCGSVGLAQLEPIEASLASAFHAATCEVQNPACPKCASQWDPNLFAYCSDKGRCQEADVSKGPLAACATPGDCKLRSGLGCCECPATGTWVAIAIAGEAGLQQLVCSAGAACIECAPVPPTDLYADCVAGQCVVQSGA